MNAGGVTTAGRFGTAPTVWVQHELDAIDEIHRLPRREQGDAFYYLINTLYRRLNLQWDHEFVSAYEARVASRGIELREGLFDDG